MHLKFLGTLGLIVAASSALGNSCRPPAETGTVTGKVTYTGTPMKMKPIDMSKEPACAKEHSAPIQTQNVTTGPGNTMEWVVVYVSAGDQGTAVPSQPVRYDQKGCEYLPHIQVMEVNQPLRPSTITRSGDAQHSSTGSREHRMESRRNRRALRRLIRSGPGRVHSGEMQHSPLDDGHIRVVLKTPHYAVTGPDGSFTIKGLPAGKYTLTAWQEQYGTKNAGCHDHWFRKAKRRTSSSRGHCTNRNNDYASADSFPTQGSCRRRWP